MRPIARTDTKVLGSLLKKRIGGLLGRGLLAQGSSGGLLSGGLLGRLLITKRVWEVMEQIVLVGWFLE